MSKQIVKGAGSLLSGSLLGIGGKAIVSAIAPKKAATPIATPPVVMPTVDDAEVKRARKRAIAAQLQRGGRASTILTDAQNSQTLGG